MNERWRCEHCGDWWDMAIDTCPCQTEVGKLENEVGTLQMRLAGLESAVSETRQILGAKGHEATVVAARRVMSELAHAREGVA